MLIISMKPLLGRQLAWTAKAVRAELEARLVEAGGSFSTYVALRSAVEARDEGGLSQRELAERMGVEGPTLVRHLDRLEKDALIERRRDERDRRITRIAVTPAGLDLFELLRKAADALDDEIHALLGSKDYDMMVGTLERLRGHMSLLAGERKNHAHATL